jgi:hypothetical protein
MKNKMWDILINFIIRVAGFFIQSFFKKPKIEITVKEIIYDLIESNPCDYVVVISPYPSRYYVNVGFSNIGKSATTLKNINLIIDKTIKLSSPDFKQIYLKPGEYQEMIIIFPIDKDKAINKGIFEIEVFDAFSKRYKYSGDFPINK